MIELSPEMRPETCPAARLSIYRDVPCRVVSIRVTTNNYANMSCRSVPRLFVFVSFRANSCQELLFSVSCRVVLFPMACVFRVVPCQTLIAQPGNNFVPCRATRSMASYDWLVPRMAGWLAMYQSSILSILHVI